MHKRIAVVAPTGVAAINAEGVTIHSLFQLPFGPYLPGQSRSEHNKRRFSKKKINLLKSLDLLIIDEISMVRSDTLDAIDAVLRRYRNFSKPFGGLQLLMIGDLHQLPPVVNSQEWELLGQHYSTPYFFGSKALQETPIVRLELKHIYRQENKDFIRLLNKVRDNHIDAETLQKLNSRFIPGFNPGKEDGFITLTSHNRTSQRINAEKLTALNGEIYRYSAETEGDFPEHAYPTDIELELKINAQVMFVKNDPSVEKRFFNGKIGRITALSSNSITVRCPDDETDIVVEKLLWENRQIKLNEDTKEVEENIIGSFKQFPLKLAWAITIHKSQGLTFDRLIIDAADAFAHGQVYVALSRCRTFEGIVLLSRIHENSVQTDKVVQGYTEVIRKNEPTETDLKNSRREYQCGLLNELFGFSELKRFAEILRRQVIIHEKSLIGDAMNNFQTIYNSLEKEIATVGERFVKELQNHYSTEALPEDNPELQQRLTKAGSYFSEKLKTIQKALQEFEIITDNKEVRSNLNEKKETLELELFKRLAGIRLCEKRFDSRELVRRIADAEVDFDHQKGPSKSAKETIKKVKAPADIHHPELYQTLVNWRRERSSDAGIPAYRIVSTKTIAEIAGILPTTISNLKKVHGIGKVKAEQHGDELLEMIRQYCQVKGISDTDHLELEVEAEKPEKAKRKSNSEPKKDTKQISYELYLSGKSVDQIAEERGYVRSTIENHLSHYIGKGELNIYDFVPKEKVEKIAAFYRKTQAAGVGPAREHFGDSVSYAELRMVLAFVTSEKN